MNKPGRPRSSEPARVLLVEAEGRSLDLEGLLWEECGCTVIVAREGLRGTQLAHDFDWELVLVDMGLPGLDGLRVLEAAKTREPGTGVVALESPEEGRRAEALRQGADDVVAHPLDRGELVRQVREVLRRREEPEPVAPLAEAEELPEDGVRVLAVGLRPGDAEAGCAGTLLRHREAGHEVLLLTLSGPPGAAGLREARIEAARRAARLLGVRFFVGRSEREAISEAAAEFVAGALRTYRPTVAYLPTPHHRHALQRDGARAMLEAAGSLPGVFCFESEFSTVDFRPSVFVDVADHIQRKARAVAEFDSEPATGARGGTEAPGGEGSVLAPDVWAAARYWGRFAGSRPVEPLEVVRMASPPPGAVDAGATDEGAKGRPAGEPLAPRAEEPGTRGPGPLFSPSPWSG